MARKAMILKALEKPKYSTRPVRRCKVCGRRHGYIRKFNCSRLSFRQLALNGLIPGVTKASW